MLDFFQKPWPCQKPVTAHPLTKGLVGAWTFNENGGGRVFNASPYRNVGDWIYQVGNNPGGRKVTLGGKGVYANDNAEKESHLTIASTPDPGFWHDAFSQASWYFIFTIDGDSSGPMELMNEGGSANGVSFGYRNGPNTLVMAVETDGADDELASTSTFTPSSTPLHMCGVMDGTAIRLYINGVLEDSGTIGALGSHANEPGLLGCFAGTSPLAGFEWDGTIITMFRYNRPLVASEVAQLYPNPYPMFEPIFDPSLFGFVAVAPPAGIEIFRRRIEGY